MIIIEAHGIDPENIPIIIAAHVWINPAIYFGLSVYNKIN